MKRLLLMMMPLLAAMLLGSCRGDDGPMGPEGPMGPQGERGMDGRDGRDGIDGEGLKTLKYTFEVSTNDWKLVDGDEPYFEYEFPFVELTSSVIDNGGQVTAYRIYDDDYHDALPLTKYHKETNENGEIFYEEHIDFGFAPGSLKFFVTNSDFYVKDRPETMNFKVVVQYY
ncbi:MAG: collagen-like protein [Bacteroidales bacterium]|nr:collagen-like protein [Bacteroidales bacterium]